MLNEQSTVPSGTQAAPETAVKQSYIVRSNRGKSRIWIQGKRLIGAGFVPGRHYRVERGAGVLLYLIHADANLANIKEREETRKVSGKGSTPIIDLSGAGCEPFATGDAVEITYSNGIITIRSAI